MGQSYHKDDAYEQALEEAELRLETYRRAKMQEVGNQEEEEEVREETPVKNKGKGISHKCVSHKGPPEGSCVFWSFIILCLVSLLNNI